MTDKEKLLAIKSEIERLSNFANGYYADRFASGYKTCCSDITSFIDSLPQEEPVSEDLEEAARKIATRHSHITGDTYYANDAWFFKKGAQWQKKQMMKDSTDVTVHIDAGGYPYIPQMELYDYDKDVPLAKEGDKYKVILIKEE